MTTGHDVLSGDFHVHSTFSDDAHSTLDENLAAASAVGLHEVRFADHVRRSTTWLPEYLAAVAALRPPLGLRVSCAVETKIMDATGALDLPPDLRVGPGGVDAVLIADHQFPGPDGPWSPEETRSRLAGGLSAFDALESLIDALVGAMRTTDGAQLAHCFSILPKVGLGEDDLTDSQLERWASVAAETGALVEVNEKWGCPRSRAVRFALDAGVRIVASTDSHRSPDIGRYDRVARILDEAGAA